MSVLIVGGGKVGRYVASLLQDEHKEPVLIEKDKNVCERIKQNFTFKVVCGDGCSPQVLRDAGVEGVEAVVATTGDDEDNFVICQLAKYEFEVPKVIARINNPKNQWLFTKEMGIDVSVNAADIIARLLLEDYSGLQLLTRVIRESNLQLVKYTVSSSSAIANKKLGEFSMPSECIFVLIMRDGKEIVPKRDMEFLADDDILVLFPEENRQDVEKLF
jgi:trk system potassium uptake protein TrkA